LNSGVIERGRPADFAVVDLDKPHLTPKHDLVSHAVYSAKGSDVTATVVGGDVLMEDCDVKTLDEDKIMDEAEEKAEDLVNRTETEEE
ncbi:MAG: amidohydrolase, partial [Halobacteria archaeon]|nr:amidohydrolase [Halobacteria archaeon]